MDRWYPDERIREYLDKYGHEFRGFMPVELYDEVEFYKVTWFWHLGITFHEDLILIDDSVYDSSNRYFQALLIHHELVHVAQQKTMPQGSVGFYVTYVMEWVRSGFNYKKMRKIGIEAEAIRETDEFKDVLYEKEKLDNFYSVRTSLMMYNWLEREAKMKMKRVPVKRRKKPGKAR